MTVTEAVGKLRDIKRQLVEIEVDGELRAEHLSAEWHTANFPGWAREGALYLAVPSRPGSPPLMGYVNLKDDLYLAPAIHKKSGRQEEFSQVSEPAVTAFRKLAREAGQIVLRVRELRALVSPAVCAGHRSEIHVELEIWWLAALFLECSKPIEEHDYNDGGPEFETDLSCNVFMASEIVCEKFIELLSQECVTPATDPAASVPAVPIAVTSVDESIQVDVPARLSEVRTLWQDLKPHIESRVRGGRYPGRNALAREFDCHPSVIDNVIENSEIVRQARQEDEEKKKAIPKRRQRQWTGVLTDSVVAPAIVAEPDSENVDDRFRRLIEAAAPADRAALHAMSDAERLALLSTIEGDPERAPGRAQVKRPRPR